MKAKPKATTTGRAAATRPRHAAPAAQSGTAQKGAAMAWPVWLPAELRDRALMMGAVDTIRRAIAANRPGAMARALAYADQLEAGYAGWCRAFAAANPGEDAEQALDFILDGSGALYSAVASTRRTDREAFLAKVQLAETLMSERFGGLPDYADTLARTLRAAREAQLAVANEQAP
jgi:hypothetical protein